MSNSIRNVLYLLLLLLVSVASALPATAPAPLSPATAPAIQTPAPEAALPGRPGAWTNIMAAQPPAPTQVEVRPADGPPNWDALVPADPDAAPRPTANLAEYGLTQVTYWSCATIAATTQCGWHRPLVPISAAPSIKGASLGAAAVALFCGAAVALLLL